MSPSVPRSSRLKKAVFTLAALLLAVLVVEGLLWSIALISGQDWRVNPLPAHPDYQVLCPLGDLLRLCPEERLAYERVRPEVFFPADDRPRVVAVGESFVFGLGVEEAEAWPARLAAHLDGQVEVLNFGRCGTYASRLAPVVQAALSLKPDLLILAIGNNEHTMTSFYTGWAGRHPIAVYRVSRLLGRFQSYGLLHRGLGADVRALESHAESPLRFADPKDQQVYAARRRPPDLSAFPDLLVGPQVTSMLEEEQRLKEIIFHDHLRGMVASAHEASVPVLLLTLPCDPTSPPNLSGVHRGPEDQVRQLQQHLLQMEGGVTDEWMAAALALDDRVSHFLHFQGLRLRDRGDSAGALRYLRTAEEWDLIPDSTPSINQIVRDVARESGSPLLDLEHESEAYLADPGQYFLDRVHLNPRGCDTVGQSLAPLVTDLLAASKVAP